MERKKTVLVADDDQSIREQLLMALEHSFEVLLAADGVEALGCYERNAERISALITDWQMPRMDGVELTLRLRHLNPHLPVIMMTGAFERAEFTRLGVLTNFTLLWKPFDLEELSEVLTGYTEEPGHSLVA